MVKSKSPKESKYKKVTDKLIELLKKEVLPWRKDWNGGQEYQNPVSKSIYRGVNPLICTIDCLTYGYRSPYFVSFNQAQEKNWRIIKDSKATSITWAAAITKEKQTESGEIEKDSFVAVKWYNVFNLDCIDDSKSEIKVGDILAELPSCDRLVNPDNRDRLLDQFVDNQGAVIVHQGNQPCYSPVTDKIAMPHFEDFSSKDAYYSTMLHELSHWTGHKSRLNRFNINSSRSRRSQEYAFEELVAELSSAFTGSHLGLSEVLLENHASYLDSWLKLFKDDEKALFRAVRLAQNAADYLIEQSKKAIALENHTSHDAW